MRIALAGNPNSGKTSMYNMLTGRSEKVGNWAGVTVDKKENPIKKNFCGESEVLIAVDLPGAYSMSPFTSEESITSGYVKNETLTGVGKKYTSSTSRSGGASSNNAGSVTVTYYAIADIPVVFNGTRLTAIIFNGKRITGLIKDGTRIFARWMGGWRRVATT